MITPREIAEKIWRACDHVEREGSACKECISQALAEQIERDAKMMEDRCPNKLNCTGCIWVGAGAAIRAQGVGK